ncbi:hypothetical protein [Clostridium minihomine]|uniref:hypothetical protein n=1 Tax=Clostridium minihomine TaxID=2045012 RepID=UPI000C7876BE|nr:hypothetical protein [Clostridium minihomine]
MAAVLALALVTSIGNTAVFASQLSFPRENLHDIVWVDGGKRYDENGKVLPPDQENFIQPRAGTHYYLNNETHLGSTTKRDHFITRSWIRTPIYKLETAHTGIIQTKVEGSTTIKNLVKVLLGSSFSFSYYDSVGTETDADRSKLSKLAYFVVYDKYKADKIRVDYENDIGSSKEKGVGTVRYEVPVDSIIDVVYK